MTTPKIATHDNISKILEMVKKNPVGIWIIDKKLRIVPTTNTRRFDSMQNDYWKEFRGLFDSRATIADLKHELG
jgi:hypothetical protein